MTDKHEARLFLNYEVHVNNRQNLSSYHTENTLRLNYESQPISAVQEKKANRSLF